MHFNCGRKEEGRNYCTHVDCAAVKEERRNKK
jgi:hypothetical protein